MGEIVIFPDIRVQCRRMSILLLRLYAARFTGQPLTLEPTDTLSAGKNHQLLMLMNIHPRAAIGTLA
jgi:hypothetical protein